jgi:hypothetical protein
LFASLFGGETKQDHGRKARADAGIFIPRGLKIITGGDSAMGEKTEFEPGDKAPNDGQYMEVGERSFHMGIENPKIITLKKGDSFPETTNDDRKWKKKNK